MGVIYNNMGVLYCKGIYDGVSLNPTEDYQKAQRSFRISLEIFRGDVDPEKHSAVVERNLKTLPWLRLEEVYMIDRDWLIAFLNLTLIY